jgi:hypothetical protein
VGDPDTVDEISMAAGIALSRWFGQEAKRVYAMLSESEEEQTIRELVDLVGRLGGHATPRDLLHHSRKYKQAHDAENALTMLKSKGYGDWQLVLPSARGGAPKRVFALHQHGVVDTTLAKSKENGDSVNVNGEKQNDDWGAT